MTMFSIETDKPDVLVDDLGHRLEVEVALVPAHEVEDGVLDLLLDERLEDLFGDVALVDEDLAEPPPVRGLLGCAARAPWFSACGVMRCARDQPLAEQLGVPVRLREEDVTVAEPDAALGSAARARCAERRSSG